MDAPFVEQDGNQHVSEVAYCTAAQYHVQYNNGQYRGLLLNPCITNLFKSITR